MRRVGMWTESVKPFPAAWKEIHTQGLLGQRAREGTLTGKGQHLVTVILVRPMNSWLEGALKRETETSLTVQWLRLHLPRQGCRFSPI